MLPDRKVLKLNGEKTIDFLNKLCTIELNVALLQSGFQYGFMLNPQGRYLFDFYAWGVADNLIYLDVLDGNVDTAVKFLNFYKIGYKIEISLEDSFAIGFDDNNRVLLKNNISKNDVSQEYHLHRISNGRAEGSYDMIKNKSIILEFGAEQNGWISFKKGCYIGQELMARTKHLGQIRKSVVRLHTRNSGIKNELIHSDLKDKNDNKIGTLLFGVQGYYLGLIYNEYQDGDVFCGEVLFEILK